MTDVGIAVEPRLLADLLVRLLWQPDRDVQRHDGLARHTYDIGVTTSGLERIITAETIIRLPDDGNAGWGTIVSSSMSQTAWIQSVDDIIDLLDRSSDD